MHLKEALQLAQFVAVIVLTPGLPAEDGRAPSQIAGSAALDENPATSELGKFLSKTITGPKARSAESDLARTLKPPCKRYRVLPVRLRASL